jgi:hypothetical protein
MDILLGIMLVIVMLVIYFLPTGIARARGHKQVPALFMLNLILGWTGFGWIAAFIWAFYK